MMNHFKKADAPYVPKISPEHAEVSNDAKTEAIRRALNIGLLGLGTGAGLTALAKLNSVLRGDKIPTYSRDTDVELPYPQVVGRSLVKKSWANLAGQAASAGLGGAAGEVLWDRVMRKPEKQSPTSEAALTGAVTGMATSLPANLLAEKYMKPGLLRSGAGLLGGAAGYWALSPFVKEFITKKLLGKKKEKNPAPPVKKADVASSLASMIATQPGDPSPSIGSGSWWRGDSHTTPNSIPWAIPAAAGAALGGTYLGHHLTRNVFKKIDKYKLEKQLAEAKKEYEEAMLSQYDPAKLRKLTGVKAASDLTSNSLIDSCFNALKDRPLEKVAALKKAFSLNDLTNNFNSYAGTGAGVAGLGAGALGLASGLATYNYLNSRSDAKLLREALKHRALVNSLMNPAELHVRPQPVEFVNEKEPDKEEKDKEEKD